MTRMVNKQGRDTTSSRTTAKIMRCGSSRASGGPTGALVRRARQLVANTARPDDGAGPDDPQPQRYRGQGAVAADRTDAPPEPDDTRAEDRSRHGATARHGGSLFLTQLR